ncbi:MAG: fructose-6-phosphate aldolase [Flavobacteriales bacterium]|nr:fructose-6-phosphate aldolase [Flavobacteriales bacterium]|tara:strand:+ start:2447 stop:2656 length:210 start_codon:yes stop_codon:yes gene_type:complete
MLYILKIKGTEKIPDFVQIRDSEMTLVAYFRLSQVEQGLRKNGFTEEILEIKKIIENIDFGIIHEYTSK